MFTLLLNELCTQQYRINPQFKSLKLNQLQDNIFFILVEENVQLSNLFKDECNLTLLILDSNENGLNIQQLSQYYIDCVCQITFKLPSNLTSQTVKIVILEQSQVIYSNYFPVLNEVGKYLNPLWYIIILIVLLLLINSPLFYKKRKTSPLQKEGSLCCQNKENEQLTQFDEIHFQKLVFYNDFIIKAASDLIVDNEVLPQYYTVESKIYILFTMESNKLQTFISQLDVSKTVSSYFFFYQQSMSQNNQFTFEHFEQQQQFYFILEQQNTCCFLSLSAEIIQIWNMQAKDTRYTFLTELELLQNERCYIKQPLNLQFARDSHKRFQNENIKFSSIRARWTDFLKLNKPCALQSQVEPIYEQIYKPNNMLDLKIIDDIASINSKYNDVCSINSQSYYTPSKQGGVKNESEQPLNDIFNEPLTRGSQGARFYDQYNIEPQAKGTNIASMAISGTQTPDRFIKKKKERELDPNELIIQVGQQLNKKEQSSIIQNNAELKQEDDFDFKLISDLELPYINDTTSLLNNLDNQLVKLTQVQDEVRQSHDSDHQFVPSKDGLDPKRVPLIYNSVSQKLFQIPEMITTDTEIDQELNNNISQFVNNKESCNKEDTSTKYESNHYNQISNPFLIPTFDFSETIVQPENHQFDQLVNRPPPDENYLLKTGVPEYNPFALPKLDFQPKPINIFDDSMNNPFNIMNPNYFPQMSNNLSQKSNQVVITNDQFLIQQSEQEEDDVLVFPQPISSTIKSVDWSSIGEKQIKTNNQMNLEFDANAFVKQDIFAEISEKGNSFNYVLNCEPEVIKNIFMTRDEYHHVFPLELEFENQATQQQLQRLTAIQNNKNRQYQIMKTVQSQDIVDYLISIGQGGRFILASRFVFGYLQNHQLFDIRWVFIDLTSKDISKLFIPCILLDYDIQQLTEVILNYDYCCQHMNYERVVIVQSCIFISCLVYLEQFTFENYIQKVASYSGTISQTLGTLFIQPQNKIEFLELLKEFI